MFASIKFPLFLFRIQLFMTYYDTIQKFYNTNMLFLGPKMIDEHKFFKKQFKNACLQYYETSIII